MKIELKTNLNYLNNGNTGFIIPKETIIKEINEFNQNLHKKGFVLGELDHQNDANIHIANASHKITDVKINDQLECEVQLETLNTPKGKILEQFSNISNNDLKIEMRGFVKENKTEEGNVEKEIIPITFDIVKNR